MPDVCPGQHPNQASKASPDDSFKVPALFGSSMVYRAEVRTMRYDLSETWPYFERRKPPKARAKKES